MPDTIQQEAAPTTVPPTPPAREHLLLHATQRNKAHPSLNPLFALNEHNNIAREHEKVYWGRVRKDGKSKMSSKRVDAINANIAAEYPTHAFLIFCHNGSWQFHRALLLGIHGRECPDMDLVPKYYEDEYENATNWLEIGVFQTIPEDYFRPMVISDKKAKFENVAGLIAAKKKGDNMSSLVYICYP